MVIPLLNEHDDKNMYQVMYMTKIMRTKDAMGMNVHTCIISSDNLLIPTRQCEVLSGHENYKLK